MTEEKKDAVVVGWTTRRTEGKKDEETGLSFQNVIVSEECACPSKM